MDIEKGYVRSFKPDEQTLCLAKCAKASGESYAPDSLYRLGLEKAILELTLDHETRKQTQLGQTIEFRKDFPDGPYDIVGGIITTKELSRSGGYELLFQKLRLEFYTAAHGHDPFYTMKFDFQQIANSLNRYRVLVRTFEREKRLLSSEDLPTLIHGDLMREEGHKGIIARLFPRHYNKNIMAEHFGQERDFEIDFGLACKIFNVFRAMFRKGPFVDFGYGLDEWPPTSIDKAKMVPMGPRISEVNCFDLK